MAVLQTGVQLYLETIKLHEVLFHSFLLVVLSDVASSLNDIRLQKAILCHH